MRYAPPQAQLPSPEYDVRGDNDGPLPQDPAVLHTLEHLRTVLRLLPDPITACVGDLASDDVRRALQSLTPTWRAHTLSHLKMPRMQPRTVTDRLAADVLSALGRARPAEQRDVLMLLTSAAWTQIVENVAYEFRAAAVVQTGTLHDRWPESVLRAAVWSHLQASVDSAYVWAWAARQPWWLPTGVSAAHGDQVAAAAGQVLEQMHGRAPSFATSKDAVSTPFGTEADEASRRSHSRTGSPGASPALPASGSDPGSIISHTEEPHVSSTAPNTGPTAPIVRAFVEPTPVPDGGSAAQTADLSGVVAEITALSGHIEAFRDSTKSLLPDLNAGLRPSVAYRAELIALTAAFDRVHDQLSGAGQEPRTFTLTAYTESLAVLQARQEEQSISRQQQDRIRQLLTLTPQVDNLSSSAQLQGVASTVHDLLELATWDEAQQTTADALDALVQIVAMDIASGTADMTELARLQTFAMEHLPLPLVMSAVTGQLSFRASRNTATTPDAAAPRQPTAQPAPDPSQGIPSVSEPASETAEAAATLPAKPAATPTSPEPDNADDAPDALTEDPAKLDVSTAELADRANVGTLIGAQRYGTAALVARRYHLAEAYGRVLDIAALAEAARSETGPCASELRERLHELSSDDITLDGVTRLLAVPALLRAAIVTGQPAAGALLTEVSSSLESNLGAVAAEVGRRAVSNLFTGGALRGLLSDLPALERQLADARDSARTFNRTRRLRFARATEIAKRWLAPDGLLGTMLDAAANNDITAAADIAATLLRLADSDEVNWELDAIDARLRGHGGKPLDGPGRHDVINLFTEARRPISAWVEAVLAVSERQQERGNRWATAELSAMRTSVLSRADAVREALEELADDPLLAGAAQAATLSLSVTFRLLDGQGRLLNADPPAALALTGELLKVPGATVDTSVSLVSLPPDTTTDAILAAVEQPLADAVRAQMKAESYGTARYLLSLAQRGSDGDATQLLTELESAENLSRDAIAATAAQLSAELLRARLQNEVSEDQDGELTSLLDAASPSRPSSQRGDLAEVRRMLAAVEETLPEYRQQAGLRLTVRLGNLRRRDDVEHITRLIRDGELSTAEELIYHSEIGKPMPAADNKRADLAAFFPAVPLALPGGITDEVITTVRAGETYRGVAALDFSSLSGDARKDAGDALLSWTILRNTPPDGRHRIGSGEAIHPVLRVIGVEAKGAVKDLDVQKSKDRRFLEVSGVTINGKAMVPAYGSKLMGHLRTLLVWGEPTEDLLLSYADHDRSGESLLVMYFGTLSPEARRRLARRVLSTSAPVVVLDDAALAYLAANGDRQFDATMAVTLPFSNVNPYVPGKRGLVAPEMFYGRTAERNAVLGADETAILFGGRGLGKSALLRSSQEQFELEPERVALYLDLNRIGIGIAPTALTPDALWDTLMRELIKREVLKHPASSRSRGPKATPYETVRAGIQQWLEEGPRRRLLVLLDECDDFFASDAPGFLETNRLKDISLSSGSRVKVVFAGLHTVQRFAKTNSNGPFSHLGRPTVIGPLAPQFAYDLVVKPMGALGYVFDQGNDLVNRILGHCSYQPFLLQMFAHRLIEVVLGRRREALDESAPPYLVTKADVERVESDPHLRTGITSAFRDTLDLDARYNVIANVLAHNAHERGMDDRLTDVALRTECLTWWPDGFNELTVEHFRAYLHEMVGLGVLAPNTGTGWHLRSPNVLRMIGSPGDVAAELLQAASASVPEAFIALETRPRMADGRRGPLTSAQIDGLLGDHTTQAQLVLGSAATGIGDVVDAVTEIVNGLGSRYMLVTPARRSLFRDELVAGQPGERRVVMSQLFGVSAETCAASIGAALDERPTKPGVTRSAVLVAGTDSVSWWGTVLGPDAPRGLAVTTLARYDARTLKVWSLTADKFTTEDKRAELLRITGGWPALVERASESSNRLGDEHRALADLEASVTEPKGASEFCASTGLLTDPDVESVFTGLIGLLDGGGTLGDVVDAIAMVAPHVDASAIVEVFRALDVLALGSDGLYRCETVVVSCWPHRGHALD